MTSGTATQPGWQAEVGEAAEGAGLHSCALVSVCVSYDRHYCLLIMFPDASLIAERGLTAESTSRLRVDHLV